MTTKTFKTFYPRTLPQWRKWLAEHHESESEVWLVFYKRHTGKPTVEYEDAVDEALCFGWVDSLIKRLDEDRYARKFTPRKADAAWSTINRKRYARLKASGRLMPAGLQRAPADRSGDLPRISKVPRYIQAELRKVPEARSFFESLTPRQQQMYLVWIDSAKKQETKIKRLQEAIQKLAAHKKPGLQ